MRRNVNVIGEEKKSSDKLYRITAGTGSAESDVRGAQTQTHGSEIPAEHRLSDHQHLRTTVTDEGLLSINIK